MRAPSDKRRSSRRGQHAYPESIFGPGVIGTQAKHLAEVMLCFLHVVFVVHAQAAHKQGVNVGVVLGHDEAVVTESVWRALAIGIEALGDGVAHP